MIEIAGYLASALVLCTFCTKTMLPLRCFAIASNVAFIAYAAPLGLHPILALHAILLPINALRLGQILLLAKRVSATEGEAQIYRALAPFAARIEVKRGGVVVRKGDPSDALYLVREGTLRVAEANAELGPGSVVGEMGVLSSARRRTATVFAATDCVLGRVSARDFQRVYFTDPGLGLRLVRLVIDRLSGEVEARRCGMPVGLAHAPVR